MGTNEEKQHEIQSLTKLGHDLLFDGSAFEASETFLNAFQIAKQTDDEYVMRGCSFNLGACYVAGGQPKVGLKYLELAIPPDDDNDGLENDSDLWYNIGVAKHSIGEIKDAILAYEKAQVGYGHLQTHRLEGECLSKLAVCYHLCGHLKDSQEMYHKAHEVYQKLGDRSNQALCLVSLTSIFSELEDIDGCAKVLDILLDVCQDVEDKFLQAKIYHDIGLLYITEKLYESASECFEQSLKCIEKDVLKHDKRLEATVFQNLGAVCNHMNSYREAIKYHQKSVDLYGETKDRSAQTQVFGNLAFAFTQLEDYTNAIMSFQHALQAAKDCGDKESQCLSIEGLAAIYFRMEDYEKSIHYYKDALSLGNEHSNRIVEKLSDAIQMQVDEQSVASPRQQKSRHEHDHQSERKRRQRCMREKQHSLIAKGLEAVSSNDDESDTEEAADHISSLGESEQTNLSRTSSSYRRSKNNSIHVINGENRTNFATKNLLQKSDYYERPVDGGQAKTTRLRHDVNAKRASNEDLPRADREYYLAKYGQEYNANNETPVERKESSKMCLLM